MDGRCDEAQDGDYPETKNLRECIAMIVKATEERDRKRKHDQPQDEQAGPPSEEVHDIQTGSPPAAHNLAESIICDAEPTGLRT